MTTLDRPPGTPAVTTSDAGLAQPRSRFLFPIVVAAAVFQAVLQTVIVPLLPELPHFTGAGRTAVSWLVTVTLLVGAVVNQRPDLFAAALPAVGVMDMLRFDRFTAGRYWVDDYGYPSKEADWRVLRTYSPYHNIKVGVEYPAMLVTTADTDDRVVPGHSFKYTAALQRSEEHTKPHLIRIETRAGHGSGKPTDKAVAEGADVLAFLAQWSGLEVPRSDK